MPSDPRSPSAARRRRGAFVVTVACVAALGAVLLVVGLARGGDEPGLAPRALTVEEVLGEPRRYLGQRVTVTGQVDVLTQRALTLGDQDLIVVPTEPSPRLENALYGVGDVVAATGTLRALSADEVLEIVPGPSLLPSPFEDFERQPVLLADVIVER